VADLAGASALELARALIACFPGLTHGELVVAIQASDVKVIRVGRTYIGSDLEEMRAG
jgi:hypothetical protein